MFIQPWDAALDEAEWRAWIADGHDFGLLAVNGLPGEPPAVVPIHFAADYAFIPGPWRAAPDAQAVDGVPTSYYTAVQFMCRAHIVDATDAKAELLRSQLAHFQPGGDHGPVAADQPPYGRMLPGIRGLRLEVTQVVAKFKYDDHKSVEHRAAVADRLTDRGQGFDVPCSSQKRIGRLARRSPCGLWLVWPVEHLADRAVLAP